MLAPTGVTASSRLAASLKARPTLNPGLTSAQRRGRLRPLAGGVELGSTEWHRTAGRERRHQDIGGRVKIALIVTTHQLTIVREGHVTFLDAGAHARTHFVVLFGVLRELQRGTPRWPMEKSVL